jgi:hypothetical protein
LSAIQCTIWPLGGHLEFCILDRNIENGPANSFNFCLFGGKMGLVPGSCPLDFDISMVVGHILLNSIFLNAFIPNCPVHVMLSLCL